VTARVTCSSASRTGSHPGSASDHKPLPASSSISAVTSPLAAMPLLPVPGAFPAGFCASQLAPLQMYHPPYIFMGFPIHPQLLQSCAVANTAVTHPSANPAKRKSSEPLRSSDKKSRRSFDPPPTANAVAYLPLVTSPPAARDRKHFAMTSSADCRDLDQDGVLDLSKK